MAKKSIFESHVPNGGGGGTVFFVTSDSHRYLKVLYLIPIRIYLLFSFEVVKS